MCEHQIRATNAFPVEARTNSARKLSQRLLNATDQLARSYYNSLFRQNKVSVSRARAKSRFICETSGPNTHGCCCCYYCYCRCRCHSNEPQAPFVGLTKARAKKRLLRLTKATTNNQCVKKDTHTHGGRKRERRVNCQNEHLVFLPIQL